MNPLQEQKDEKRYLYLLSCENINAHLKNPATLAKLRGNFTQIKNRIAVENVSFNNIEELGDLLFEKCGKQKWFKDLKDYEKDTLNLDAYTYVAYYIWDCKRITGNIVVPEYFIFVAERHFYLNVRNNLHEAGSKVVNELEKKVKLDEPDKSELLSSCTDTFREFLENKWQELKQNYFLPTEKTFNQPLLDESDKEVA